MKSILLVITLVFAVQLTRPVIIKAENGFVRLALEVDKKRVNEKFNLLFYVNKIEVEPLRFENGFVVPDEVSKSAKVDVRVIFRNYDLLFEGVPTNAFKLDWIVGVDLKPFDHENVDPTEKPPIGKKLTFVYYITYVARTTTQSDTRQVVKIYK
jgi:hypothetical protein